MASTGTKLCMVQGKNQDRSKRYRPFLLERDPEREREEKKIDYWHNNNITIIVSLMCICKTYISAEAVGITFYVREDIEGAVDFTNTCAETNI